MFAMQPRAGRGSSFLEIRLRLTPVPFLIAGLPGRRQIRWVEDIAGA